MDRRDVLKRLALGAAAAPLWIEELTAQSLAHGDRQAHARPAAASEWMPNVLTPHQNETVATLAERIIPQTETAGAKAAKVNEFIDAVLEDAESSARQKFISGLAWIDERSRVLHGADFVSLSPEQQIALLTPLSLPVADGPSADSAGREFFRAIRSMTITGYYTSEIGMREELGDDGNLIFEDYLGGDAR